MSAGIPLGHTTIKPAPVTPVANEPKTDWANRVNVSLGLNGHVSGYVIEGNISAQIADRLIDNGLSAKVCYGVEGGANISAGLRGVQRIAQMTSLPDLSVGISHAEAPTSILSEKSEASSEFGPMTYSGDKSTGEWSASMTLTDIAKALRLGVTSTTCDQIDITARTLFREEAERAERVFQEILDRFLRDLDSDN